MTFIDICAGIGGFRYGLEKAGHKCIGYIEKDKFARQSYGAMYNTEKEWNAVDVTTVKPREIPYADIWTFGFPCQSISLAGKREGISGAKSGLFFDIIKLIKGRKYEERPKLIIAENVANLLSINKGWDFATVLSEMDHAGYDIEWCMYNSKDFGVPQSRKRIYIVGHLRGYGRGKVLPFPRESKNAIKQVVGGRQGNRIYDPSGTAITLSSNSGGFAGRTGLYFIDLSKDDTKITDISRCIVSRYGNGISNRKNEKSGIMEVRACLTPDREEIRQNGRRVKEPYEPMFTLTAQDRHGIILKNIEEGTIRIRRLTPLECFRLQGFPDELFYKVKVAGLSDSQLYKQAGNAVTTTIPYEIGKNIKKIFD